jgi:hypothetical protein
VGQDEDVSVGAERLGRGPASANWDKGPEEPAWWFVQGSSDSHQSDGSRWFTDAVVFGDGRLRVAPAYLPVLDEEFANFNLRGTALGRMAALLGLPSSVSSIGSTPST